MHTYPSTIWEKYAGTLLQNSMPVCNLPSLSNGLVSKAALSLVLIIFLLLYEFLKAKLRPLISCWILHLFFDIGLLVSAGPPTAVSALLYLVEIVFLLILSFSESLTGISFTLWENVNYLGYWPNSCATRIDREIKVHECYNWIQCSTLLQWRSHIMECFGQSVIHGIYWQWWSVRK